MQTSAAIAAAAVAQERAPDATLKVDWDANGNYTDSYDDLSARIESLTITRQLASDLPDEVAGVAGYSSAQLDVVLAGDPTTEADNAWSYFSPFNTASALYGKRRRWRTCQVQLGFAGTTLPAFTGKTTSLKVDVASRSATLSALDNAETMRGPVDLPVVVADNKGDVRPGLPASWVIDYIARACGYYATPPARSTPLWAATFAGSAYPHVGTIHRTLQAGGLPVTTAVGKFIQAINSNLPILEYNTAASGSTNNNAEVLMDGWIYTQGGTGFNGIAELTSTLGSTTANKISLTLDATSNHLMLGVRRTASGTITWYDSGVAVPLNQWVYVGAHLYVTSSAVTIHFRVNATSATVTGSASSITGQAALNLLSFGSAEDNTGFFAAGVNRAEAWQVSNPGTTTSAPTWNNGYVSTATIQASLNSLIVTVPTQASAWDTVQAIAAAEFATVGFDESGNFTYYTRNRWTAAPYTTSQRTISSADSLTALSTSEDITQVRNHIRAAATPAALNTAGWVWNLSTVTSVPASGSTTVTADLGGPVYGLSTSIRYASSSGMSGQSQYRANAKADGSGAAVSNLTFTVTVSAAQIVTITITNPNAFIVYLVSSSGFTDPAGTPSLALWGQQVLFATSAQPDLSSAGVTIPAQTLVDVSDSTSIGQHGDQLLDVPDNPWRQDGASLNSLATDLLARLKDPPAVLEGLTIIGDPRLQLGDRITVSDIGADFFLSGIVSTFDDTGYTQALSVRAIS